MESIVNSENHPGVTIFRDLDEMSVAFFDFLDDEFHKAIVAGRSYHLVLSGGSTPLWLFQKLASLKHLKMNWDFLHLYWGDERCVPPEDPQSNFGNIWSAIIRYIDIPEENVHRIMGENDPDTEASRYAGILKKYPVQENGMPRFDLVLLGVGEDGHTASIFPDALHMLETDEICYTAIHPESGQKRISVSMKVINNAKIIIVLAAGSSKAEILRKVIQKNKKPENLPASFINPSNGTLKWFVDKKAGKKLKHGMSFF